MGSKAENDGHVKGAQASVAAGAGALNRIVVGIDERAASHDALALAAALCGPETELIVASVRPYWPGLLGREDYHRVVAEDTAWIEREATSVLGERPFVARVVAGGHETEGLKEVATAERADLIVVGSTHRGTVGRVLPGSVGERVLDNAPCAVGIAPRGLAESGLNLKTIAVAFDGSKQAEVALRLAIELAQSTEARLLVLGAVEFNVDTTGLQPEPREAVDEARMLGHFDRAEAQADAAGVLSVEARLLFGKPDHVLSEAASSADLLLLGSRGHYGPARRLFLGSVAAAVAREAPCATLITPAA